jgi:hypothetical protein
LCAHIIGLGKEVFEKEEVHDHRYDFTSTILYGHLDQELFEITSGDAYILEEETCNPSLAKPKESISRSCFVIKKGEQHFEAGSRYSISHDVFHRVASSCGITYLVRSDYKKPLAHVVRKKDAPSVCAFSVTIEETKLWDIVEEMLTEAKEKTPTDSK